MRATRGRAARRARGPRRLRRASRLRVAGGGGGRGPARSTCPPADGVVARHAGQPLRAARARTSAGISAAGMAARDEIDDYLRGLVAPHGADGTATRPRRSARHRRRPARVRRRRTVRSTTPRSIDQLVTLFIGGTETLPKVVAGGAYQLWRHPEQRAALVGRSRLWPRRRSRRCSATSCRCSSSAARCSSTPRSRARRCAPGNASCSLLISANRDEREFADPERFDVHRRMERHLGLGHGAHVCIGAHVARLEGRRDAPRAAGRASRDYEVDPSALEREASEFQVGWATMPIATGLGSGGFRRSWSAATRDVDARGELGHSSRRGTGE